MRSLLFIFSTLTVIALAFWAYHENYKTQTAIHEAETLQRDIAAARERLSVLRAEWAYLNRPDRLSDLAALNFDRLGLLPLRPDQFGRVDQVAYPPVEEPPLEISEPIDVTSQGQEQQP